MSHMIKHFSTIKFMGLTRLNYLGNCRQTIELTTIIIFKYGRNSVSRMAEHLSFIYPSLRIFFYFFPFSFSSYFNLGKRMKITNSILGRLNVQNRFTRENVKMPMSLELCSMFNVHIPIIMIIIFLCDHFVPFTYFVILFKLYTQIYLN